MHTWNENKKFIFKIILWISSSYNLYFRIMKSWKKGGSSGDKVNSSSYFVFSVLSSDFLQCILAVCFSEEILLLTRWRRWMAFSQIVHTYLILCWLCWFKFIISPNEFCHFFNTTSFRNGRLIRFERWFVRATSMFYDLITTSLYGCLCDHSTPHPFTLNRNINQFYMCFWSETMNTFVR